MLWWWFILSIPYLYFSSVTFLWYFVFLITVGLIIKIVILENLSVTDLGTKHVFITGCDTGFGHQLALKLVENGIPTFAGCFTEEGKIELEKKTEWAPGKIWLLSIDVTSDKSVAKAAEFIEEKLKGKGLWGLVCNAGTATALAPDDWLNVDDYKKTLEVNTFGVIRTCHAFKPLIKKEKGRIVVMSSMFGRVANPWTGPYVVSKFAVESYADIIRLEGKDFGYSVHIMEPGFFNTNLNINTFLPIFQSIWDRTDDRIKKEYGERFCEKCKPKIIDNAGLVTSDKIHWVTDAYYSALTSRFPRLRYQIGIDANLLFIPISFYHTFTQDLVMMIVETVKGFPIPAVCRKTIEKKTA